MQLLILSCNTGQGHNSCAKAIKEVFEAHNEDCLIVDALGFVSQKLSRVISRSHVILYRDFPGVFNWGYDYTEKHAGMFKEKGAVYNLFATGAHKLWELVKNNDFDAVLCTHPFAALMLSEVKKKYELTAKTAFLATDYTCSPSVKDSALDHYFIPDASLAHEFMCENIPEEKMVFSGIPVRRMFYRNVRKSLAKQCLGISPEHRHVVMMCGSMGCGPIGKSTDTLPEGLKNDIEVTVVCGTNEKRRSLLERNYGDLPNLHIVGYVEDVSTLLDSADLFLTKAGGISVTEAAVKKVPMVLIDAVSGCEKYNRDFFLNRGCAAAGRDITELVKICGDLLHDKEKLQNMAAAYGDHGLNAAECIYETLSI